jgi:hypothetical protein
MLGSTRELCIFDFGNFRIGRYLTVTALSVEDEILNEIKVKDGNGVREWKNVRSDETISKMVQESSRRVIRGVQPIRTPFFLQKRLDTNSVPRYLWDIIKEKDEESFLLKHPCVGQALRIENYMVSTYLQMFHQYDRCMSMNMK